MKTLLVMCGSGIATSTVVTGKIKTWLKDNGYEDQVKLYQSKVAEEINRIDDYDIVISTTVVPDTAKDKVIMGLPLLTGIGTDALWAQIKEAIEA
ncbi:PTS sugar transporter subunit IIB [Streptococcus didelphis]|uniref:PTS sugar transporter subunit IIB n=1 Tax=Streptococcus didelphis TaxID=102886 RepID=A0ABY9LGF6_9STRE|nr:PTS sugar transporter subunit IIB [Streptococcus didelphis]WMB27952.1 PTS sugar transporter subunit IIB [Streptococcus didelphis]WMB29515.1 PTS sugar transporter subunit IIB [Streptococcus didelphis]WMB29580.1 PTS sugar transporter subunit IIB [Streptococcus didelphis]